jgi:uncharacterized protein YkwD
MYRNLLLLLICILMMNCGLAGSSTSSSSSSGSTGSTTSADSDDCSESDLTACQNAVLALTNDYRADDQDCGTEGEKDAAGDLTLNDLLSEAAQGHAEDMAEGEFLSHTGSDGSTISDRVDAVGYAFVLAGENAAYGQDTSEEVVAGWLDSDGHCANMMNEYFTELGVGFAESDSGVNYWVQVFGLPID